MNTAIWVRSNNTGQMFAKQIGAIDHEGIKDRFHTHYMFRHKISSTACSPSFNLGIYLVIDEVPQNLGGKCCYAAVFGMKF